MEIWRDRREFFLGRRQVGLVQVQGHQRTCRANASKQFRRMASEAERAIDDDLTGLRVERSQHLIEHDRPMSPLWGTPLIVAAVHVSATLVTQKWSPFATRAT